MNPCPRGFGMTAFLFTIHYSLQTHLHSRVFIVQLRILPQQFFSLFRDHFRKRHLYFHKLIAVRARLAQRWCAAFAQAKLLSRLRARRNAQLCLAFHGRHFNLRTQRALRYGYRNGYVDIVALAREILCVPTLVMMCRSPGGAPSRPPSPLPGIRTREPVSTPAGILTFTVSVFGMVPLPLHKEHGDRLRPVPPQSGHSCAKRKRPPARCTCPEPLHVAQTITGPPMSPAPLQREHCSGAIDRQVGCYALNRFFKRERKGHLNIGTTFGLSSRRFRLLRCAAAKEVGKDCRENLSRQRRHPGRL